MSNGFVQAVAIWNFSLQMYSFLLSWILTVMEPKTQNSQSQLAWCLLSHRFGESLL